MPTSNDALHGWIRDVLGVTVARRPLIDDHDAPFDYIAHAFFERSDTPRDAVVWASRGGGKTMLGAVATVLDLVFKPGIEVRILAGSLEQAGRMHTHLRTFFSRPGLASLLEGRMTSRRVTLANGSEMRLLAQSEGSVRGTRVQKLRCDEVELFDPEVWEAAQLVTRSKRCGKFDVRGSIECLSTMHRPQGIMHRLVSQSGLRRLFRWSVLDTLEICPPRHRCHGDSGPCPLWTECAGRAKERTDAGHLTVDDAVSQKQRVDEATWEAEMLCRRPNRSNCVLREFDPDRHIVDELPEGMALAGMDFGFRAPTVVLSGTLDASGTLTITDERHISEVVLDAHIRALVEGHDMPAPSWVGVDPAGAQRSHQTGSSAIDLMRRAGLSVRSRRLPVHDGLMCVRRRLASNRLCIHRRCPRLIEAMQRYHYSSHPGSIEPVKDGSDHAIDALRYLVCNLDAHHDVRTSDYLRARHHNGRKVRR